MDKVQEKQSLYRGRFQGASLQGVGAISLSLMLGSVIYYIVTKT
jgi:hypothetical protein